MSRAIKQGIKLNSDSRQSKLTEKRAVLYGHTDMKSLKEDAARGVRYFWRARGMDEPLPQSNFDPFAVSMAKKRGRSNSVAPQERRNY